PQEHPSARGVHAPPRGPPALTGRTRLGGASARQQSRRCLCGGTAVGLSGVRARAVLAVVAPRPAGGLLAAVGPARARDARFAAIRPGLRLLRARPRPP